MAPTTSFAPSAARFEAWAEEIRVDLDGRSLIEQLYGVMFRMMLHCLVRICHQLDARAEAERAPAPVAAEAPGTSAAEATGTSAAGQATPRFRLHVVASRAALASSPTPAAILRSRHPAPSAPPKVGHPRAGLPASAGWFPKNNVFPTGPTHVQFVTI